jgi:nucleoside-triphosphatase THEP1
LPETNEDISNHKIVLVTGDRQIGKSTVCRKLAECARTDGYQVSGLLTYRTGNHDLEVTELHTNQSYPLTLPFEPLADRLLGNFLFSPDAVKRSNAALDSSFPTQIFFLDELGPLELKYRQGWVKIIPMLGEVEYIIAIIVVRPDLLTQAIEILPSTIFTVVCVNLDNRDSLATTLYDRMRHCLRQDSKIT